MNIKSLLPWHWSKLDPTRTRAAREHFDVTGKYDLWHTYCREQFRRKAVSSDSELSNKGVEIVRLLSNKEAAKAKQLLLDNSEQFFVAKKSIKHGDLMRFKDSIFLQPIVEKMLNKAVDAKVTGAFGSEYYVHSLEANRTMPVKESKRAFLWHCDRGPKNFLKINMFLDATSEHGGTTEFIDLESSFGFEKAGYTFGANARRVADIHRVAQKFGGTANVIHPQLEAGEAFIFFPTRLLHRGFLPTRGIRHMLSIVLLPSPIHWTEAWKKTSETGYHLKTHATFPANAEDLYLQLGLSHRVLGRAA